MTFERKGTCKFLLVAYIDLGMFFRLYHKLGLFHFRTCARTSILKNADRALYQSIV